MAPGSPGSLPGFHRRIRITPMRDCVCSELEDDYHRMRVVIHHDGKTATAIEPEVIRAPWTTCPGAVAKLHETFTGTALAEFAVRGEKLSNCTHLHDLALLAAAHVFDEWPLVYDIFISDPVNGQRSASLNRDGESMLSWTEAGFRIVEPAELAGTALDKLRPWIDSLPPAEQEAARLLRWANIIAEGRVIPLAQQSDASRMTPSCYTFQPERKLIAQRIGVIRDFNTGAAQPLD